MKTRKSWMTLVLATLAAAPLLQVATCNVPAGSLAVNVVPGAYYPVVWPAVVYDEYVVEDVYYDDYYVYDEYYYDDYYVYDEYYY